jgi:hypothetical protein
VTPAKGWRQDRTGRRFTGLQDIETSASSQLGTGVAVFIVAFRSAKADNQKPRNQAVTKHDLHAELEPFLEDMTAYITATRAATFKTGKMA